MAQGGGNERQMLGKYVRNQSGYGTTVTSGKKTSQHVCTRYIRHAVSRDDTLFGLALKYQVTVEMIKKENKLFTNDMMFLKEHIIIPVTPENENLFDPNLIVTVTERERSGSVISNGSQASSSGLEKEMANSVKEEQHTASSSAKAESSLDFFNKYDSSLAKLKSDVAKMEKNAEYVVLFLKSCGYASRVSMELYVVN